MWFPEKSTDYHQSGWPGADWAGLQPPARSLASSPQSPIAQPPSLLDATSFPQITAPFNPWMRGLPNPSLFFTLLQGLDCVTADHPDPQLVLDLSCKREPPSSPAGTAQSPAVSCASQLSSGIHSPSRKQPYVRSPPAPAASPPYQLQQSSSPLPPPPPPSLPRLFHIDNTTPLDPPNRLPDGNPEVPHTGALAAVETAAPGVWNALAPPYYPSPMLSPAELFNFLPLTLDQNMTCPFCRKAFRFEKNLLRHLQKTHATGNGESILKCKLCSYTTRHYSNMYVHIRTHTGDKPYTCSGCGAAFTQGSSLKLHIKSRHNDNLAFFSLSRKPGKNNLTKLWTRVLKKDLPKYEATKFNSMLASYYRLNYYHLFASASSSQSRLVGDRSLPSLRFNSQPENEPPLLLSQFPPFSLTPTSLPDLTPLPLTSRQSPADQATSPDAAVSASDGYYLDTTSAVIRPTQDRSLLSSSSSSSPASSFMVRSLTDELPPSDCETSNGTRCAPAVTPKTEAVDFASAISPGALYDAILSNPTAFQPSKVKAEKLFRWTL